MLSIQWFRKLAPSRLVMTGLALPIFWLLTSSGAQTAEIQRPENFQRLQNQHQGLRLLQASVKAAYQSLYGSGTAVEFPQDLPITFLLGRDGDTYSAGCGCYGVTQWIPGAPWTVTVVVVEDTGEYSQDAVLAHELAHVLQVLDGRWVPEQRQQFEDEADMVMRVAMTQFQALGAPQVLKGR